MTDTAMNTLSDERLIELILKYCQSYLTTDETSAFRELQSLRSAHPAVRVKLEQALAKVRYVPGDHPVVPVKHVEFVQEVESILSSLDLSPAGHPDDLAVDRFAAAMKAKLAKKRAEGRGGWQDKDQCTAGFLSQLLRDHVEKGDPLDVGNLAMMLHQRGERLSPAERERAYPIFRICRNDAHWALAEQGTCRTGMS